MELPKIKIKDLIGAKIISLNYADEYLVGLTIEKKHIRYKIEGMNDGELHIKKLLMIGKDG